MARTCFSDPLGQHEANTVDELVRRRIEELDEGIKLLRAEIETSADSLARRRVRHDELVATKKVMEAYFHRGMVPT